MAVAAAEALYLETETLKQELVDTAQATNLLRGEWQNDAKNITDNIQRLSKEKKVHNCDPLHHLFSFPPQ